MECIDKINEFYDISKYNIEKNDLFLLASDLIRKIKLKIDNNELCFKSFYIVNDLEHYIGVINSILLKCDQKGKNRERYIFRGLSKVEELNCKIKRANDEKCIKKEFEFIRKFEENGSIKLGQFNNPLDLAAAAEHYGTYTRLIDWSRNPFVATLFALYNKSNDYCAVLFHNENEAVILNSLKENLNLCDAPLYKRYESMINEYNNLINLKKSIDSKVLKELSEINNIYLFQNKLEKLPNVTKNDLDSIKVILDYFKSIYDKTYVGDYGNRYLHSARLFFTLGMKFMIDTNYSNERLVSQRGLFEIQDIHGKNDFSKTSIIFISPNARNEIIKYIDKLGINYYTLMNDPQNASNYINDTIVEKLSFDKKIN